MSLRLLPGHAAAVVLVLGAAATFAADSPPQPSTRAITFARDIAPLLFERCAGCHHPGGDGPFSLLQYADVRKRASTIVAVTQSRYMPPWKSEPGFGDFVGHRHLSESEIQRIAAWAAAGAPEGDPADLPPEPSLSPGWRLGAPDLVVSVDRPYTVRADGPDFSRTFVLPVPLDAIKYARGLEFHPGTPGVVHHANIRIDRTAASRKLDGADPEPGYFGLLPRSAVFPDGHFLGWTPGQVAPLLPADLAWRVTPGTDLVVELHFVPTGKPEQVTPKIGLYLSDVAPTRTPALLRLGRQDFEIPAGQQSFVTSDSFTLPVDVEIIGVQPHAHYRAREIRGTATLPDGTALPLIYIKDWDYRWQHVYQFVTPLLLPRGTLLSMRYLFDNSAANPRNPHQPPRAARWGQQSSDEMGDLWIQMLPRRSNDLHLLNNQLRVKHITEEAAGYETMIRGNPSSVSLHNDVALLYADLGQADNAARHFRTVLTLEPTAPAHFNLATALSASGRTAEAITHYRQALQLHPAYGAAHNNLAQALLTGGDAAGAERHFGEALRVDPDVAGPHYNLAVIAQTRGRHAEAVHHLRHAVGRQPDWVEALSRLAWLLATGATVSSADAVEAERLAQRAADLTHHQSAAVLDILAATQAAKGGFAAATATLNQALQLRPDARLGSAIQQRLALYARQRRYISWGAIP